MSDWGHVRPETRTAVGVIFMYWFQGVQSGLENMGLRDCPPRDMLYRWASGDLAEDEADAIAEHLDTCSECERTIADSEDAGFLACGDVDAEGTRFGQEAQCEAFVNALQELPQQSRPAPSAQPDQHYAAGRRIRDYQLLEPLGQGAMGVVFEARHTRLNRHVAIKLLTEKLHEDPAAITRFQREMQAVGLVEHPHIVRAFDAGRENGVSFLVMELIDGVDLAKVTSGGRQLRIADACEVGRQVAVGLQYAHARGLVHRDVKPSNLMLTRDSNGRPCIKILDLGLATIEGLDPHEHLTDSGQLMGTLEFMAPEQAEDTRSADQRADLYSLGATLFRLLAGSVPFAGPEFNTPAKRLKALMQSATPSIASRRSDLPPKLVRLIDRLLAREPDERPRDMAEVAARLEKLAAGHDLESVLERSRAEQRRSAVTKNAVDAAPSSNQTVALAGRQNQPVIVSPNRRGARVRPLVWLLLAGLFSTVLFLGTIWVRTGGESIQIKSNSVGFNPLRDSVASAGSGGNDKTTAVPLPTRTLPDLTKSPHGKVRVFGTVDQPMGVGAAADYDDFVEVQMNSNVGWFGLRSNGDVMRWHVDQGVTLYRDGQDVRVLNRTAGPAYGEWLGSDGRLVVRNHPDNVLLANAPQAPIVDLARSYPTGNWTVLTDDGRLHYIGKSQFPPPRGITDFVRLGNWHDYHVGIRESGALVVWGSDPAGLPDLSGLRFAKIRSTDFYSLLLTVQGTLVHLTKGEIVKLPEELNRNGWIDIACGTSVWAARQADGHWRAWGDPESATVVAQINSLGTNVPSLSMTTAAVVWIEAE